MAFLAYLHLLFSGVKVETLHVGAEKGTTAVSAHLVLNVLGHLSSRRRNTSPGLLANAVVKHAQLRGVFRHAKLCWSSSGMPSIFSWPELLRTTTSQDVFTVSRNQIDSN